MGAFSTLKREDRRTRKILPPPLLTSEKNSFSYIILEWQTDDEEAQAARIVKRDKMRSQGPIRDRIETFILMKQRVV